IATLAYPDDWGRRYEYIHHAFFGEYVLTWLDEEGDSHFIGRAETLAEAYDKLNAFRLQNKDIPAERLRAVPEVFVPPDITRVSTGRLRVLQSQLKMAANLNSAEVQAALRGVVGQRRSRQKFWGALMQRQGAKGFEQDFWRVWEAQTTMYHRWVRLTEMNRAIVPVIEKIRSRGLPSWAEHLQNTLDYVWARKRDVLSERTDQLAQKIPLLGRFLKPFMLERSLSMIRAVNYYRHLQTVRFYVLNRFQPLQTLWPVVGERGMFRGFRRASSGCRGGVGTA
ncbi:MAG: hypothetical protein IIA33_06855, partial [Planctomycetes bacterium]|nr:hypothetical protein [Planctomycetota bacterium]